MWKDAQGNTWYRGNMHMHTKRSDGRLPYEEAVQLYRDGGYDFLAVTDHWKWSELLEEPDFVTIPGCEYDVGTNVRDGIYHIVAVGCREQPALTREDLSVRKVIDAVHGNGGLAILAHPSWSLNRVEQTLALPGFDAAEIYNTFSGTPWNCRPYSGDFIDMMAASGYLLPCMAADDSHRYAGEQMRSYIMVKAEKLSAQAILEAIRKGEYIATQGPMMSVYRENDRVVVDCTEAEEVVFCSDRVYSSDRVTCGHAVTHAECRVYEDETVMRVEVKDRDGRTAWSSPIRLQ